VEERPDRYSVIAYLPVQHTKRPIDSSSDRDSWKAIGACASCESTIKRLSGNLVWLNSFIWFVHTVGLWYNSMPFSAATSGGIGAGADEFLFAIGSRVGALHLLRPDTRLLFGDK
jgi:hypothetical protein